MSKNAKVAEALCKMASDDLISYEPTGETIKVGHSTYHVVIATTAAGRQWRYALARDYGSYKGMFLDNI